MKNPSDFHPTSSPGDAITPFWERLHKVFIYPFHPHPAILMASIAIVAFLYLVPILGIIVAIATSLLMVAYSFEVLKNTANGILSPPELNFRVLSRDILIVLKLIVLYIIIAFAFILIAWFFGAATSLLFMIFVVLFLPSSIMTLVITNSLLNAINPTSVAMLAWRIGWGYLLMYFFLILFAIAQAFIGNIVSAVIPAFFQISILVVLSCYYWLISNHLMGYVLLQYHDSIGYRIGSEEDELLPNGLSTAEGEVSDLLNRTDALVKEGNTDDAIYIIKTQGQEHLSNPELSERYFNLLRVKGLVPEMLENGKAYLDLLARSNQKEKLCEVYLECAAKSKEFVPSAASLFKIASALNETGRPKDAVRLYNRFVKADPHHSMVPKAYFLGATIIHEKLKDSKKAAGILKGLIKKFPNHEIVPYAMRSLKQIKIE